MIIIYGTRYYGRIDEHGGEYQVTRFAHVYWLPLLPIGTMWVREKVEDGLIGHGVRWSARSVLAGYARIWGPILAVAGIASGTLTGVVAGVAAAALSAWSWTWSKVRGARERRRSAFHAFAYGTRCDPRRMPRDLADALRDDVDARWAAVSGGRTAEDIARFGAADAPQAALAYATARLAARTGPPAHARRVLEVSERILDGARDDGALLEGGPYRSVNPTAA